MPWLSRGSGGKIPHILDESVCLFSRLSCFTLDNNSLYPSNRGWRTPESVRTILTRQKFFSFSLYRTMTPHSSNPWPKTRQVAPLLIFGKLSHTKFEKFNIVLVKKTRTHFVAALMTISKTKMYKFVLI